MAGVDYDSAVMYPFGYGLSYTDFEQTITNTRQNGDTDTVTVDVTNTGSVAGKSVVELYCTPPYTNGSIEKAAVNLVGFEKTGELAPGKTAIMTSYIIEGVVVALLVVAEVLLVRGYLKKKKGQ